MGEGCAVLAGAGADQVVGADQAWAVIEAAGPLMPPEVTLQHADLSRLPFADGTFDVVICFDLAAHLHPPAQVIDELGRVRAPGGLLIAGWPDRAIPLPGASAERPRFDPPAVRAALHERFASVRLFRQSDWIASAIVDEGAFSAGSFPLPEVAVHRSTDCAPAPAQVVLAVAGDAGAPMPGPAAVLGDPADIHGWQERFDQQQASVRAMLGKIGDIETERKLLLQEVRRLEQRRSAANQEWFSDMQRRVDDLERDLATMRGSTSWRVTAPMRAVLHRARRLLRAFRRVNRLLSQGS
jgi:SAM-dependent methyltransferase